MSEQTPGRARPAWPQATAQHQDATAAPVDAQAAVQPYVAAAVPQQATATGNSMAVAGMVLGITSIVFFWWGLFTLAQIICAIVFGAQGLKHAKTGAGGKGMATAGVTCGIIASIGYLIFGLVTLGAGFLI